MIINCNGAAFEHDGVTYTIGAPIIGTDQSEYEGLTGHIFEIRDGADKETENTTPDLYCCFDAPDDPVEITELEAAFSSLYREPKKLEDIILDFVVMAPDMVKPYQTYRIPVIWESWGILNIDAASIKHAAVLALDSEMPLPDQKEYVDDSIQVDWEGVGGCNDPIADDSHDRFRRVAQARIRKVLKMLALLGNCSHPGTYEYTQSEVDEIFAAIETEVVHIRELYDDPHRKIQRFSLQYGSCEHETDNHQ